MGKEDRYPYLGWSGAGEGLSNGEFRHAALSLSLIYLEKVIILFVIASKLRRRMLMASLSHANLA